MQIFKVKCNIPSEEMKATIFIVCDSENEIEKIICERLDVPLIEITEKETIAEACMVKK